MSSDVNWEKKNTKGTREKGEGNEKEKEKERNNETGSKSEKQLQNRAQWESKTTCRETGKKYHFQKGGGIFF
jgi:hypothetical protein